MALCSQTPELMMRANMKGCYRNNSVVAAINVRATRLGEDPRRPTQPRSPDGVATTALIRRV